MPTTAATVLAAVSNAQAIHTPKLVDDLGMNKPTVLRHLRALATKGFIFCEDDYEGRNRKGGKYSNALWVINGETNGFNAEQAQTALNAYGKPSKSGLNILMNLNLCC